MFEVSNGNSDGRMDPDKDVDLNGEIGTVLDSPTSSTTWNARNSKLKDLHKAMGKILCPDQLRDEFGGASKKFMNLPWKSHLKLLR